jgi:hypothetical protein
MLQQSGHATSFFACQIFRVTILRPTKRARTSREATTCADVAKLEAQPTIASHPKGLRLFITSVTSLCSDLAVS